MNEPNSYKRFDSIQPLPRRAVPSADEDLLSIIRRSASRMGYEDLRWILRPQEERWDIKEKEIPLLSKMEDYHVLQHLLLLSEEQLYNHTLHRFAPLLEEVQDDLSHRSEDPGQHASKRKILLSPISKGNYFLPTDSIKVCPLCLREQESYDRLYWRMQLILYCPHHRVCLLEKCPACEAPISAHRHIPYRCPHCQQGDYRAAVSTLIRTDHPCYVGELLFLKMLGIMISEEKQTLPTLARSPLLTLSSRAYLHLLGAITSKLAWVFSLQELVLLTKLLEASPTEDLALQHVLYTTKRSVLFLLFNWLFLEWPMHFATFLDALYSISTPPFIGEKHENVNAYSRSLFNDSVDQDSYAWLHQAYQQYHQQFRFDPTRTDHLREKMNYLAQSMHKQQRETPELMQSKASDLIEKKEQMLYIPPRLLTPTLPYPWESITSVLSRAAEKMKHPFPELLLYRPPFTPNPFLIGSPNQPDSFGEPRLPFEVDDQILAYLLQIPLEDLSQLSRAQLVSSLGLRPYGISHQYAELNETDLNSWLLRTTFHITKICPSCVREQGGYDRLYWNLVLRSLKGDRIKKGGHLRERRQDMPKILRVRAPQDEKEEKQVRKLAGSRHGPADWILHARIVARSWDGERAEAIAQALQCDPQTVRRRIHRFDVEGLEGLGDRTKPGRPRRLTSEDDSKLIALVNQAPPGRLLTQRDGTMVARDEEAEAQWSLNALAQAAKEAGIAVKRSQIRTILLREGVRWRHTHSWGTARDKDFVPKGLRSSPTTPSRRKGRRPSAATNSAPYCRAPLPQPQAGRPTDIASKRRWIMAADRRRRGSMERCGYVMAKS